MRPHVADVGANLAFFKAILQGVRRICLEGKLLKLGGHSRVVATISTIQPTLLSPKGEVVKASAAVLRILMAECIPSVAADEAKTSSDALGKIIKDIVGMLSYRYKTAWQHAFAIATNTLRFESTWKNCDAIWCKLHRHVDMRKHRAIGKILHALDSLHQGIRIIEQLHAKWRKYIWKECCQEMNVNISKGLSKRPSWRGKVVLAADRKIDRLMAIVSGIKAVLEVLPLELPTTDSKVIQKGESLQV